MIFIGNNLIIFMEFKKNMVEENEMADFGEMLYFLTINIS